LCRVVLDLGSGSTGVCAVAALASCAQYVFLCPSLQNARSIQAEMRPSSHLFVCERLKFATTSTFTHTVQAVQLLQDRPAVLILHIRNGSCSESELLRMQSCAAAELMQGSLLIYIDYGLSKPLDLAFAENSEDGNGVRWLLIHKGRHFKVLQLSA
jgi:hypothetical protein